MLKIGLTGGIGSGKTTVSKVFELLGIPVFYADEAAREVMHKDQELVRGIIESFGQNSYSEGVLNRKHISDQVFNKEEKLQILNSLVHPAVFRAFDSWVLAQHSPYVIKEAAILFESGSYKLCDQTIVVTAREELRIDRVIARSGLSADEIRSRMARQITEEQAVKLADHVIRNDEKQLIIPQVLQLHELFLSTIK